MLKKTIKYTNYNGIEMEGDFYFNLTKPELIEMEASTAGGLETTINKIVQEKDNAKLIQMFKDLVLKSYGEKSPDGMRFEKSEELSRAFSQTAAYENLFMELAVNPEAATEFVNGIIPKDLSQQIDKNSNIRPISHN